MREEEFIRTDEQECPRDPIHPFERPLGSMLDNRLTNITGMILDATEQIFRKGHINFRCFEFINIPMERRLSMKVLSLR